MSRWLRRSCVLAYLGVGSGCGYWVPLDDRIGVHAADRLATEEARQDLRDQDAWPAPSQREERDPQGRLRRSWSELIIPGERPRKHGLERAWDEHGQLTAERNWSLGSPEGRWRTWHPNGALRSQFDCAGSAEGTAPTRTEFWHSNGVLAASGPGFNGVRDGLWSHYSPEGQLLKQGAYQRGTKNGIWSYWREDGSLEARGTYAAGTRVGAWERPNSAGE